MTRYKNCVKKNSIFAPTIGSVILVWDMLHTGACAVTYLLQHFYVKCIFIFSNPDHHQLPNVIRIRRPCSTGLVHVQVICCCLCLHFVIEPTCCEVLNNSDVVSWISITCSKSSTCLHGIRKHDRITPVLAELYWLPVASWITFKIALLTSKAITAKKPDISLRCSNSRPHPGFFSWVWKTIGIWTLWKLPSPVALFVTPHCTIDLEWSLASLDLKI